MSDIEDGTGENPIKLDDSSIDIKLEDSSTESSESEYSNSSFSEDGTVCSADGDVSTIVDGYEHDEDNALQPPVWTNPYNDTQTLPIPIGNIYECIKEMDKPMRFDWRRIPMSSGAEWVIRLCEKYYGIDTKVSHEWLREAIRTHAKDVFEDAHHYRAWLKTGKRFRTCSRQLLMMILLFYDDPKPNRPAHEWVLEAIRGFVGSAVHWQNKIITFARRTNGCYKGFQGFTPHDVCYFRCNRLENEPPLWYFMEAPASPPYVHRPWNDD